MALLAPQPPRLRLPVSFLFTGHALYGIGRCAGARARRSAPFMMVITRFSIRPPAPPYFLALITSGQAAGRFRCAISSRTAELLAAALILAGDYRHMTAMPTLACAPAAASGRPAFHFMRHFLADAMRGFHGLDAGFRGIRAALESLPAAAAAFRRLARGAPKARPRFTPPNTSPGHTRPIIFYRPA